MADEFQEPGIGGAGARAEPATIALALNGASRDEADAFLRRQRRLTDLQIEDLERDNRLRHRTLRFGSVSAVMKVTFEIALAIVMLALASLIAFAVWTAAHDDGLVIEAFNVPSGMVAQGLTGQVIATQVQDRIAFIQSHADTLRAASTFRNNWGDDIKVQIPDTGISTGEAYRFVARWLGDETHITGEIWHDAKGVALSARAGNAPAKVFRGPESSLDSLITKAAEYVYWQTQPYRYTVYLDQQGRHAEALAVTKALALNGAAEDRAWAYSRWGFSFARAGDFKGAKEKNRIGTSFDARLSHLFRNMGSDDLGLGHDESALHDVEHAIEVMKNGGFRQYEPANAATNMLVEEMVVAEEKGDFLRAIVLAPKSQQMADYNGAHRSVPIMMAGDLARDHDVQASLKADSEAPNEEAAALQMMQTEEYAWDGPPLPQAMRAVAIDDWRGVRDDLAALETLPVAQNSETRAFLPTIVWPWLAYAYAKLGDNPHAQALIEKTPRDCYLCVRMRGNIEAARWNWRGAAIWFAEAVRQGPSLPFAYTDWGEMLLAKGEYDSAIAKFEAAHAKSPRFADPLELWGEALMQKSRSDLALAKFEEANKYAPNWARLHLKWGEALVYADKKVEARKQFEAASRLNLSISDKAALTHWMKHV